MTNYEEEEVPINSAIPLSWYKCSECKLGVFLPYEPNYPRFCNFCGKRTMETKEGWIVYFKKKINEED